jgi:hypothetical protein
MLLIHKQASCTESRFASGDVSVITFTMIFTIGPIGMSFTAAKARLTIPATIKLNKDDLF